MTWPTLGSLTGPAPWLHLGGVALGVWCAAFLVASVVTRPRRPGAAGAPHDQLGPETPAVAHLLTHRCRVTPTAASATLVDLAARGAFGIESIGGQRLLLRLRGGHRSITAVTPAEQAVLAQVEDRAVQGEVPAAVLAEGSRADWFEDFRRRVEREATDLGLVRQRWSRPVRLGLVTTGTLALLPFAVAFDAATGDPEQGISMPVIGAAWVAALLVARRGTRNRFHGLRPTPAGDQAARRWLGHRHWLQQHASFDDVHADAVTVWDRRLAYACAVGCARVVAATFPLAPEPDDEAWSPVGGRWREVEVRYPSSPGHGRSRSDALLAGIPRLLVAGTAVVAVVALVAPRWLRFVLDVGRAPAASPVERTFETVAAAASGAVLLGVLGWCTLVLLRWSPVVVRALRDGGPSEVIDGVVVKLADRPTGRRNDDGTPVVLPTTTVDDGRSRTVTALHVRHPKVRLYDRVRVEVSPHLCHVRAFTRVPEPGPPDRQDS